MTVAQAQTPPPGGGSTGEQSHGGMSPAAISAAARAPAAEACPLCGAPLHTEQEWCLNCGAAARTRLAATPNWKIPIAVLACVVALSLGVLAAALVKLTGDSGSGATVARTIVTTAAAPTTPVAPTTTPPTAGATTAATTGASGAATAPPSTATTTATSTTTGGASTTGPAKAGKQPSILPGISQAQLEQLRKKGKVKLPPTPTAP